MTDENKKWLYLVGGGLILAALIYKPKKKDEKKPPSLLGDGTDDGTGDGNPPDTNPPDTNPPDTNPPANPYPIMPAARATMLQKNINFFFRKSTDPDTDSGSNLNVGQIPVNGQLDNRTVEAYLFLIPYLRVASRNWRGNLFMLNFFNREATFDETIPENERVLFAISGTADGWLRTRKLLYDQLTTFDLTAAREGFFPDYNDYDAAAFGDATE